MHFAISATWGPTDTTRAMLPFLFAASAVQEGDEATIMLFHDSVLMALAGVGAALTPVGPPNRFEEIAGHEKVTVLACKPCFEVRGLLIASLHARVRLAGMNEYYAAARRADTRVVSF
jgi:tRNA 2-thiouridine synthesizing protein D